MGYYIRKLNKKKSLPHWKIQFVSYKNHRRTWDIPKERWRALGFHPGMTAFECEVRARQLNSKIHLQQQEERLHRHFKETLELRMRSEAFMPKEFVEEFEMRFIHSRIDDSPLGRRRLKRRRVIWTAAQKMIIKLNVEPSEWFYHLGEIYDYFEAQELSISYIHSVLKFANLWGFFISKKLAKPFLPIEAPRGYDRQRLLEAFYQSKRQKRFPSRGLTPQKLKEVHSKLNPENYNYLLLTLWFGLRPQEVDNLFDKSLWTVEQLPHGPTVLKVFQTKIVALPYEDRWKPIPILFSEQEFALKIIYDGNFKRPLSKTIRYHFGRGYDLYSGRKGFTDLMLTKRPVS